MVIARHTTEGDDAVIDFGVQILVEGILGRGSCTVMSVWMKCLCKREAVKVNNKQTNGV